MITFLCQNVNDFDIITHENIVQGVCLVELMIQCECSINDVENDKALTRFNAKYKVYILGINWLHNTPTTNCLTPLAQIYTLIL